MISHFQNKWAGFDPRLQLLGPIKDKWGVSGLRPTENTVFAQLTFPPTTEMSFQIMPRFLVFLKMGCCPCWAYSQTRHRLFCDLNNLILFLSFF